MTKPLPHLQFAVLAVLSAAPLAGRELRTRLSELGIVKSGPAFYRLMARLEESGLVTGWYEREVVDGQAVRERLYRVTPLGLRARTRPKTSTGRSSRPTRTGRRPMRDPHDHWALVAAGRLLPRTVRVLVFEPLCSELIRGFQLGDQTGWARSRLVAQITRAFLESILFGFPRYFREPGRATRLGRLALLLGGGVFGVLVLLLAPWITYLVKAGAAP